MLTCKNKNYVFKLDSPYGAAVYNGEEDFPIVNFECVYISYEIINDRIVLDNSEMQGFISLMGATMNIDYNRLTVEVRN